MKISTSTLQDWLPDTRLKGGPSKRILPVTLDGQKVVLKVNRGERRGDKYLVNKNHPHLVNMIYYAEDAKLAAVVMESCETNFLEWCQTHAVDKFTKERETFFGEILQGLQYLHSLGLIHEDVKIDNILLKQEHAKLADFEFCHPQTQRLPIAGCLYYSSPEKLAHKTYDHRSDWWSLGVTFYEVFYDHMFGHPEDFDEDTREWDYTNWLDSQPVVDLSKLPSSLVGEQIKIFLAYRPEDRFIFDSFQTK